MARPSLWTLALLLLACDPGTAPTGAPAKTGDAGDTRPPAAKHVEEHTNVSGDRAGLVGCLSTCKEGKTSATDQETCRLNCQQSFKVSESSSAADKVREAQLASHVACAETCAGGPEGARASCLGACKDASPELAAVADSLSTCVGGCMATPGQSDTDRATCKLNCRAVAGSTLSAARPAQ